jgi:arylsulfatase A-like enzyme
MLMNKTTRRDLLKTGAALAGAANLAIPGASAAVAAGSETCGSHWDQPPKQQGNNLNVILIVADTFRADNLAAYGSQWVDTPHLNRLAEESIIFEDLHPEGMPTIPTRRVLNTGRRIVPTYAFFEHETIGYGTDSAYPGWHHLYNEDVTLAETLVEAGYVTALIADLPHLQRPGRNFHRSYTYWEWIRGQETDYYAQPPRQVPDFSRLYPAEFLEEARQKNPEFFSFLNRYTANRKRWLQYGDSIVEQTAKDAVRWLKENHDQGPFLLHIESFDPHEPWDPPEYFLEKYLKSPGPHSWPQPYHPMKVPPEGVQRLRANYAGEASNVDYWMGQVLNTVEELGLKENTIVVFTSDHGAMLGEQDQWLKGEDLIRKQVTHVPLLMRLPNKQYAGKRVSGLVQHFDIVPTLLDRLNVKPSPRVTGENLWPYVTGERTNRRDHIVSGFGYVGAVRTEEWNYSAVWNRERYKGHFQAQLYDRKKDPDELVNVAAQNPAVIEKLQAKMDHYISSGWEITKGSFNETEASFAKSVGKWRDKA